MEFTKIEIAVANNIEPQDKLLLRMLPRLNVPKITITEPQKDNIHLFNSITPYWCNYTLKGIDYHKVLWRF